MEKERLGEMIAPLLSWYEQGRKSLPWREDATPYHVWLSEIMLQQTRWSAVLPYYERFLREVPTLPDLAVLSDEKLMKLWEGLGYYSRARNLKKAAICIMEKYGGAFPETAEELETLSGIGAYTAGAIASICFGKPTPAVDGNVLRVVMRLQNDDSDIADMKTKKKVTADLAGIYPTGEAASMLTQALMELGEEVCIPNGAPHCEKCPLSALCLAKAAGRERELPRKSPKKGRRMEDRTVFLLSCRGKYAVSKRESKGLLADLWEFPGTEGHLSPEEARTFLEGRGLLPVTLSPCGEALHIFTHVEWHMQGYAAECVYPMEGLCWQDKETLLSEYAIPSAFRYFLDILRRGE